MTENQQEILEKAVRMFGRNGQIIKSVEEMAELSVALLHEMTGRIGKEAVISEIADVEIMLAQLRILYGSDAVKAEKEKKLLRLQAMVDFTGISTAADHEKERNGK